MRDGERQLRGDLVAARNINRILIARGLRAFGDGYVSLLLPLYLLELGYSPLEVGIIATATLLGSGLLALAVGLHAYRFHFRTLLLAATALLGATGIGFAFVTDFLPLLAIAFAGTLNPSSGDVSVFLPLEHAMLSRVVGDRDRTAVFARYSLVGSLLAAVGSLAAGLPYLLSREWGITARAARQGVFVLYAVTARATAAVYRGLPAEPSAGARKPPAPLTEAKAPLYTPPPLLS